MPFITQISHFAINTPHHTHTHKPFFSHVRAGDVKKMEKLTNILPSQPLPLVSVFASLHLAEMLHSLHAPWGTGEQAQRGFKGADCI